MAATILITGATGLIGFRILVAALEAGHVVRYTARSEQKARIVSTNPVVQKLAPGGRLSSIIIPDFTVEGAFDAALQGATHIINLGMPMPSPHDDLVADFFKPMLQIAENMLASAIRAPSVQRVIIASSGMANVGLVPPATTLSAATRHPVPDPLPTAFDNAYEAYVMGKIVALHQAEEFTKTHSPHFTVSHVMPGYVFGRDERALHADALRDGANSNGLLMAGMLGREAPFPMLGGFTNLGDVADVFLRAALLDAGAREPKDYGIAAKVDYSTIFDHVEKAFPKAVEACIFKRGQIPTVPVDYDSTDAQKLLGRELKSFETTVVEVAARYLELLGVEKA